MTKIEWTDAVWNPVTGCGHVSAGCKNCYAEVIARQFWKGRDFGEVRCHPERLVIPLRWRKPRRVFVNSMSDIFHEAVSDGFILEIFRAMRRADWHTYQILTKRPKRMLDFMQRLRQEDGILYLDHPLGMMPYLGHVWLGVSVENERTADERIQLLRQTPAAVRFVSYEPAIGPVDFRRWLLRQDCKEVWPSLDWLIVGGESGSNARPCDVEWIRSAVEQGRAAGVPVFVKQIGTHPSEMKSWGIDKLTSPILMKDRKGGDPSEWPADLRVREFPRKQSS